MLYNTKAPPSAASGHMTDSFAPHRSHAASWLFAAMYSESQSTATACTGTHGSQAGGKGCHGYLPWHVLQSSCMSWEPGNPEQGAAPEWDSFQGCGGSLRCLCARQSVPLLSQ